MSYRQQWEKHNSSINTLKNNVIYCIVEQNRYSNRKKLDSISNQPIINKYPLLSITDSQSKILFDVGLKSSMICFHTELTPRKNVKNFVINKSELLHLRKLPINPKVSIVKIVNLEIFGEHSFILPKIWSFRMGKQQAWLAIWKRFVLRNIVRGFLLNSVKGGYAIAIGKSIAFLPKSLRLECDERIGEYRFFEILNMRSDIKNIVVKEVPWFIGKKKFSQTKSYNI